MEINEKELMEAAYRATKNAYAPYSRFSVGAALLSSSGRIYTGCNVENASFGATNCAERTALFKAISEGEREFLALAVIGLGENAPMRPCPPCGICRQVLSEHCKQDLPVLLCNGTEILKYTLGELLPLSFGADSL